MSYKVTIAIPEDTKTLFPSAAMDGSNLHICSAQFGPPNTGASLSRDTFPFSCFSCQAQ